MSEKELGVISYHEGSAAKTGDLHNSLKRKNSFNVTWQSREVA